MRIKQINSVKSLTTAWYKVLTKCKLLCPPSLAKHQNRLETLLMTDSQALPYLYYIWIFGIWNPGIWGRGLVPQLILMISHIWAQTPMHPQTTWGPCYKAVSDSGGLDGASESPFLTSSQVRPMLLVLWPHPCSHKTAKHFMHACYGFQAFNSGPKPCLIPKDWAEIVTTVSSSQQP